MQCGLRNDADGLLCPACLDIAKNRPTISITQLAQNNAMRQNIIKKMAERISELEAIVAKGSATDESEQSVEFDAISTMLLMMMREID